jgi:DNA polymerase III delta prime subunit
LLAVSNGQVVNIEAETYIAGDQIITHIYEAPPPPLPPAEAKMRRELGILLNKVKTFWIEGVLETSVHNMALIDLGKETQAEAVAHAWDQVLELPDQSRQTLRPDKKMSHIFDEMHRALLILGEPGTGKTITLLQLARDLIERAEQDERFIEPVPVVFNLSTWRQGEPLLAWLATELSTKYQIPKRIGQPWLEQNRLLPLLDGLDEVNPADRAACVEAINAFGEEYGLSGLAVCSRLEEYTALPVRLKLNGAMRLQPLSLDQVYDYLEVAGEQLTVLRTALQVDDGLQSLAQIPLTLGIMVLSYQGLTVEGLVGQDHQSLEARRRHLFERYIERMFRRKGKEQGYDDEQTKQWLSWLARNMQRHNQEIFLIEGLQPSWLPTRRWRYIYTLASRLIAGSILGLLVGLLVGLIFGLSEGLSEGLILGGLSVGLSVGLIGGLSGGLSVGLIDVLRFEWLGKWVEARKLSTFWWSVINVVILGLIVGLSVGLFGGLSGGLIVFGVLRSGLIFGLAIGPIGGLIGGLIFGLRGSRQSLIKDIQTIETLRWSWRKALKGLLIGLFIGLLIGLIFGLLFDEPSEGLIFGLIFGLYGGLIGAIFGGLSPGIIETKTAPNQGIRLSARNAIFGGLSVGLIFGLGAGLIVGLGVGLFGGLSVGLFGALWYGGFDLIQHYTLRLILLIQGHTPRNYARFLDYSANLVFLQKVGGGYRFIHRLLLEHFAEMDSHKP